MKKIFITILLWIVFFIVGCDPNEEESVSGTYKATSMVIHPGGDCSASDGITEICTSDPTVTSEADCPVGMCFDQSGSDESSCPEDLWVTGMCENGDEIMWRATDGSLIIFNVWPSDTELTEEYRSIITSFETF